MTEDVRASVQIVHVDYTSSICNYLIHNNAWLKSTDTLLYLDLDIRTVSRYMRSTTPTSGSLTNLEITIAQVL